MKDLIAGCLDDHRNLLDAVRRELIGELEQIGRVLIECARGGGTIFWCGNGGSASDAQHLAAELVGRFNADRPAIASVALTTNTSTLTAVANDYGFDRIFARQVEALVRTGDVLVAISTSGNSANVYQGVLAARERGATVIGLLGRDGGMIAGQCTASLVVPSSDTARIQEMHITLGHILCQMVEQAFLSA